MSFILDALRKSEHERQRQTGPALVESVAATPKVRTNRWATAAIVLLVVNLLAIGGLLLLRSGGEPAPGPSASGPAAPAAATTQPSAATATTQAAAQAEPSLTGRAPPPPVTGSVRPSAGGTPPMLSPAAVPVVPGRNPLESEVVDDSSPPANEALAQAAIPPEGPPAVVRAPARRGTVVYETLPDADPVSSLPPPPAQSHLPTADEVVARGGMAELRLELHVYSAKPAERFVFVNGHRYREGDTMQEGPTIQEITRDGVVMSLHGSRFLLPRE